VGSTPYVRWGNYALLALCAFLAGLGCIVGRARR